MNLEFKLKIMRRHCSNSPCVSIKFSLFAASSLSQLTFKTLMTNQPTVMRSWIIMHDNMAFTRDQIRMIAKISCFVADVDFAKRN